MMMTLRISIAIALLVLSSLLSPHAYGAENGYMVQISLAAIENRPIPYEIADHVVNHLSQNIDEAEFTNILRGDDKIILTFYTSLKCRDQIRSAVHSLEGTDVSAFAKTETWKQEETPLPPEISFRESNAKTSLIQTSNNSNENGTVHSLQSPPADKPDNATLDLKQKDEDRFNIKAHSVPLGKLLESISQTTGLEYICPQTIASRKLTLNCNGVSVDSLLASLKLSMNLSIKRTGRIVVFVDTNTER